MLPGSDPMASQGWVRKDSGLLSLTPEVPPAPLTSAHFMNFHPVVQAKSLAALLTSPLLSHTHTQSTKNLLCSAHMVNPKLDHVSKPPPSFKPPLAPARQLQWPSDSFPASSDPPVVYSHSSQSDPCKRRVSPCSSFAQNFPVASYCP